MIKLKSLLREEGSQQPDPSLKTYLLENKVVSLSDWLYHGSPFEGLKEILTYGIYGTEHGEVAEHDSFSTSANSEMLHYFSEGNGDTGLQFKIQNAQVIVLDDVMVYLVTQLPGSGFSAEVDENELVEFQRRFSIPIGGWKRTPYLPYGYLSFLGVDAFAYDYVWDRYRRGNTPYNDESEICFIGKGIDKLNKSITGIYIDGNEYELEQKAEALQDLEGRE